MRTTQDQFFNAVLFESGTEKPRKRSKIDLRVGFFASIFLLREHISQSELSTDYLTRAVNYRKVTKVEPRKISLRKSIAKCQNVKLDVVAISDGAKTTTKTRLEKRGEERK